MWTKLASGLTVSFTNTVSGPDLADLQGAMRLDVSVASADGWSAYLNSSPVVALANGTATAAAPIDVTPRVGAAPPALRRDRHVRGRARRSPSPPSSRRPARSAAWPSRPARRTPLTFTLDATSLRLADGAKAKSLTPSTQTPVTVDEIVPRRFTVLGVTIPIGLARILAAVVLALALVVLAAAAWIGRTARGDVADEFVVKHAARILPVAAFDPGPTVIDVSDPEALHRVAERFDTLVLHHAGDGRGRVRRPRRGRDLPLRRPRRARGPRPATGSRPGPGRRNPTTSPRPCRSSSPAPLTSVSAGLWGRFA